MDNKKSEGGKNYQVSNVGVQVVNALRPQTHTGGAKVHRGTDLRSGGNSRKK